jgi:hypothetical protein
MGTRLRKTGITSPLCHIPSLLAQEQLYLSRFLTNHKNNLMLSGAHLSQEILSAGICNLIFLKYVANPSPYVFAAGVLCIESAFGITAYR